VAPESIWTPLRRPAFRALWTAAVVSNVGTWMHDTAAAWTMTTPAPSPTMVSLMQTATRLPFFVLALPADPVRWLETFVLESWLEHLRQHARAGHEDAGEVEWVGGRDHDDLRVGRSPPHGAERLDRLGQRELLAHHAGDEASAAHLAARLERA
jgi:transmembrane secretion effector